MIAGVSGSMLSSGFLARHVQEEQHTVAPEFDRWVRATVRWWQHTQQVLGPASPPRLVFDVGARPLLELLGYSVAHVEPQAWGHAAVLGLERRAGRRAAEHGLGRAAVERLAPGAPLQPGGAPALGAGVQRQRAHGGGRRASVDPPAAVVRSRAWCAAIGWRCWRCGRSRTPTPSTRQPSPSRLAQALSASDAHGVTVCSALGAGVLDALGELVSALDAAPASRGRRAPREAPRVFEQSLTIVYRLLFLLFAEARQLVPMWHRVYRDSYSVGALCQRLMTEPHARGVWAAVQAMSRLAHAGCLADDLRVTAFNGRLFAPARTPLAEQRRVPDAAAARAVLSLGTTATPEGRRRIAFHDLGVEQLGAVYERVLEYEPVRQQRRLSLRATSTERKTTGSFYTPRAVTDFLVRRTLGPLVDGLPVGGHPQAARHRSGDGQRRIPRGGVPLPHRTRRAGAGGGGRVDAGDIVEADRADLARAVAEQCLYGIDRNPTAVQLARLSLWLTTLAANRPLTFLDHHLAVGNSLIGARLADLGQAPAGRAAGRARRDGEAQRSLFDADALEDLGRAVVPERLRLSLAPSAHTRRGPRQGAAARSAALGRKRDGALDARRRPLVRPAARGPSRRRRRALRRAAAARLGPADDAGRPSVRGPGAARAAAGADAWRLSLGAAVPRGLPARGRPPTGRRRLRCGARAIRRGRCCARTPATTIGAPARGRTRGP